MQFPTLPPVTWLRSVLTGFFVRITGDTMTGPLGIDVAGGATNTLLVRGDGTTAIQANRYQNNTNAGILASNKARGTIAAPLVVQTGDQSCNVIARYYHGAGFVQAMFFNTQCIEPTPSATAMGCRFFISLNPLGSVTTTEVYRLEYDTGLSMYGANVVIDNNRVYRNRIYTVATLPAGVQGMRTFVSDSLAPVFGAAVAGGGAVTVPVYYTGAAWFVG